MDTKREAEIEKVLPAAIATARAVARRAGLRPADQEDLEQIALIEVIRGRERWDPTRSSWKSYAINCARWGAQREVARIAAANKRRGTVITHLTEQRQEELLDRNAADTGERAEKEELTERAVKAVREHISQYPAGSSTAKAVEMVLLLGESKNKTAAALKISRRRVDQIVQRALNEIRTKTDRND